MNFRRYLYAIVCAIVFGVAPAWAALFETDFEPGNTFLGSFKSTYGDDEFSDQWTVTRNLVTEGGNRYLNVTATVPQLPMNDEAAWYGGYYAHILSSSNSIVTMPDNWTISFEVRADESGPIRVRILEKRRFNSPTLGVISTSWVTLESPGWHSVALNSSQFSEQPDFTAGISGSLMSSIFLEIGLASHDSNGNPLSLASVGSYTIDIDNVLLVAVPEIGFHMPTISCGLALYALVRIRAKNGKRSN